MEKIKFEKRDFILLSVITFCASIFTVAWLMFHGNKPQIYKDIILEFTAAVSSNKTAEMNLLWILIFGGIAICLFAMCIFKRRTFECTLTNKNCERNIISSENLFVLMLATFIVLTYILFQQTNNILFFVFVISAVSLVIDKKSLAKNLYLYFLSYYVFHSLYRIFVFVGGTCEIPNALAIIFAFSITTIILTFRECKKLQRRIILIFQCITPFLFLLFTVNKYLFNGKIEKQNISLQVAVFVTFAIAICLYDAVRKIKLHWKNENAEINDLINLGTCVAICVFNFCALQGAIAPTDYHHNFEDIIGFNQIFEVGQIPFKQYIPVSGMYSVVEGAFFRFFGRGMLQHFNVSRHIYYATVIAITIYLLHFHLKMFWCFCYALIINIQMYSRVLFILPIILILLLPQLVARRNLWLKVFLWTSVFHGLFYPVNGAAVAVGFVPMFVWQVCNLVKENQTQFKTVKFWICWIISLIPILLSLPLLWGTFVHIKAMSSQSVLAYGISVFGQDLPSWFMPYARNVFRFPIYYVLHFIPFAFVAWSATILLYKVTGSKIMSYNSEKMTIFTICAVLLCAPIISYTFTFVRMDMNTFFARIRMIMLTSVILFAILFSKYIASSKTKYIFLCLLVLLVVLAQDYGIYRTENKFYSHYRVPNDFVHVENDSPIERLNNCYMPQGAYNHFVGQKNNFETIKDEYVFGKLGSFAEYYLLNAKGNATLNVGYFKSYDAAKEIKDFLLRERTLTTPITGFPVYYVFNWLVLSGDYIWSPEKNSFVYNEGAKDFSSVKNININAPMFSENHDVGNSPNVLGLSMKSLNPIFTEQNLQYVSVDNDYEKTLFFDEIFSGKDADFIYIKFNNIKGNGELTQFYNTNEHSLPKGYSPFTNKLVKRRYNFGKKVFVSFYGEDGKEHNVNCHLGQGELLIPLGVGYRYLLENHDTLRITLTENGEQIPLPEISEMRILKLRTIY